MRLFILILEIPQFLADGTGYMIRELRALDPISVVMRLGLARALAEAECGQSGTTLSFSPAVQTLPMLIFPS